jgi:hypothetical protein
VIAAAPDLLVITGDQVDDYADDVAHFAAAFGGLRAPLGVFAIAGNHDVYAGWADVHRGMSAMGLRVLVNEAVQLSHRGMPFWLAGTGDPAGLGGPLGPDRAIAPDIPRTLSRIPAGAFTIVLAHNPALWPGLASRGVNLTLSSAQGCTLGGNQDTTSDSRCSYKFLRLVPGTYIVKAQLSGFRTVEQRNIVVNADATARADLQLPIGQRRSAAGAPAHHTVVHRHPACFLGAVVEVHQGTHGVLLGSGLGGHGEAA